MIRVLHKDTNKISYSTVGLPDGCIQINDDGKLYTWNGTEVVEDTVTETNNTKRSTIATNLNNVYDSWNKGLQSYFKHAKADILSYINANDIESAEELIKTYPLPNESYATYITQLLTILGVASES